MQRVLRESREVHLLQQMFLFFFISFCFGSKMLEPEKELWVKSRARLDTAGYEALCGFTRRVVR